MFLIIRKPSWSEARAAIRIIKKSGLILTAKEIMSNNSLVAVDENGKVIGVMMVGNSRPSCFALDKETLEIIKTKIA